MTDTAAHDPLKFYLDKSSPAAWKAIGALSQAVNAQARAAGLSEELIELVCLRVSQINGCAYCLDVHTKQAVRVGVSAQRLGVLAAWAEADIFSEEEKAALRLAESVTHLHPQEEREFAQVYAHDVLTEEQYAAVQWLAIFMNTTNRISILSHHPVR